jgi:non-heme chloroperoxidase
MRTLLERARRVPVFFLTHVALATRWMLLTLLSLTDASCTQNAARAMLTSDPETATQTQWTDARGFPNGRVAVDGTWLHYVDYGGSGAPLVFLAGLGNSAHIFDDFAPRFTDLHHVVAITRRGYGESGRPQRDFETGRLVADLEAVLDSLRLQRVVLVGHSVAGGEMTAFATTHPDRVDALVYLDAAYDRHGVARRILRQLLLGQLPPSMPKASGGDRQSVSAYAGYLEHVYGVRWPESEVRATRRFDANGRYAGEGTEGKTNLAVARGEQPIAYSGIVAPTLAIYSVERSVERDYPWIARMTIGRGKARLQAEKALRAERRWERDGRRQLATELPGVRIVELRDASHYLFISHADSVAALMREFLGKKGGERVPR